MRRGVIAVAAVAIATAWLCLPLLRSGGALGIADWDVFTLWHASVLRSIAEYGQPPFWNPWYCGGWVLWQNPQIPLLSAAYPLSALVPLPLALKIDAWAHVALAFAGMLLAARLVHGLASPLLALAPAALFAASGFVSLHLTEGHVWVLATAWMPFAWLGYERYRTGGGAAWIVLAGAALAAMVWRGGIYPAPFTALFLCAHAAVVSALERDTRALRALALAGGYASCFAAPKLLPAAELFGRFPRTTADTDTVPLAAWGQVFLERGQLRSLYQEFPGQAFGWHEYGCYVGAALAIAVAAGIVHAAAGAARRRPDPRQISLAIGVVASLAVFAGSFHPLAPWELLHRIPPFDSLHVPSRFSLLATFAGALLVTGMLARLEARIELSTLAPARRRAAAFALAAASIAVTADLVESNSRTLRLAFPIPTSILDGLPGPFEYAHVERLDAYGAYSSMYPAFLMNLSLLECYDPHGHVEGARLDDPLVVASAAEARIGGVRFSPNRVTFSVDTPIETIVSLNQNHSPGWRLEGYDARVVSLDDRPSVTIPAGRYDAVAFAYRPPWLPAGTALFALAVIAAAIHVARPRRREPPV